MRLERLHPDPSMVSIAEQLQEFDPRSQAPADRPYVYANFAASIDGRATLDGVSGEIGSDCDTEMLMALRASADAVLVGAGTLRAEQYGRLLPREELRAARIEAGHAPDPLAATLSSKLDLPWDAGLFNSGHGKVVVFTDSTDEPPQTTTPLQTERSSGRPDLRQILEWLRRERGVRALLCEGGPSLHGALVRAGLVDELFLTTGAMILGGRGVTIVEGLDHRPRSAELRWLLRNGSELFSRYTLGVEVCGQPPG